MKKFFPSLIFAIYSLVFSFSPAFAQTAAPTKAPTATPTVSDDKSAEIKERVLERIQEVKNNASKRGFWGTIKEINNNTLLVATKNGDRLVKTDSETKFILNQKSVKISDLAIDNFTIVMGYLDDTGTLLAKRVVALSKAPQSSAQRQSINGVITDISKDEEIIVVTPLNKNLAYEVQINDNTTITKKTDTKVAKSDFSSIKVGDQAVVVAAKGKSSNSFTAKIIHIIPGKTAAKSTPTPTQTE